MQKVSIDNNLISFDILNSFFAKLGNFAMEIQ